MESIGVAVSLGERPDLLFTVTNDTPRSTSLLASKQREPNSAVGAFFESMP